MYSALVNGINQGCNFDIGWLKLNEQNCIKKQVKSLELLYTKVIGEVNNN